MSCFNKQSLKAIVVLIWLILVAVVIVLGIFHSAKASTGGDCDGDGRITMGDPVWLINYIFAGGPEPNPCECPQSFFLFDNQIPQAVETYYFDQDWEEAYVGGRTFAKGGPVRRVYSIGPDSQPSWFLMVPDTVVWETPDTSEVYVSASVVGGIDQSWAEASAGTRYPLPDVKAMMAKYGGTDTIPADVDSVDFSASKKVAWFGLYSEPEWLSLEEFEYKRTMSILYRDWEAGLITYREYLDLRLNYKPIDIRVKSIVPKGVVIDSVKVTMQDAKTND